MSLNTLPAMFTIGTAFLGLSPLFFPAPSAHNAVVSAAVSAAVSAPASFTFDYGYGQHLFGEVDTHLSNAMVGTTTALVTIYAAHSLKYLLADDDSIVVNNVKDTVKLADDFCQGGLANATAAPQWIVNNAFHIPSRLAILSGLTGVKGLEPARSCSKDSPTAHAARKMAEFRRRAKESNSTITPLDKLDFSTNDSYHLAVVDAKASPVSRFWSGVHSTFLAMCDRLDEKDFDQGDFFGVFDIRAGFRDLIFEGSDSDFGLDGYDGGFSSSVPQSVAQQTLSANDQFEDDDLLLELDIDINGGHVLEARGADYDFHDDGVFSAFGYTALSVLVAWYLFSRPSTER